MKYKLGIIIICATVLNSCKKPKIGEYVLEMTFDQGGTSKPAFADEYKVTRTNIYFGGAYPEFEGVLNRKNNKVSGELVIFPGGKFNNTITVNGEIKRDGSLNKHKIVGTFNYPAYYSGTFVIHLRSN